MHSMAMKRLVLTLLAICCFACSQATEEQCDKAFDHYFHLKSMGVPEVIRKVDAVEFEVKRPQFLSECVGRTKTAILSCWFKAETLQALKQCESNNTILR